MGEWVLAECHRRRRKEKESYFEHLILAPFFFICYTNISVSFHVNNLQISSRRNYVKKCAIILILKLISCP